MSARFLVVPTLDAMAAVYQLSRDGGAASARFRAYVPLAASTWGVSAYNPMAGDHAADTVRALQALRAESLLDTAAALAATLTAGDGPTGERRALAAAPMRLALAVLSPGLWTERITSTNLHRTHGAGGWARGIVPVWSRDPVTAPEVLRQGALEGARLLWEAAHGAARTVLGVLAREGTALVVADAVCDALRHGGADSAAGVARSAGRIVPSTTGAGPAPDPAVANALAILGASVAPSDAVAVLLGDEAAGAHGWSGLGIAPNAGERHAHWHAQRLAQRHGIPALLHARAASWLAPDS